MSTSAPARLTETVDKMRRNRQAVTTPALAEALVNEFGGIESLARTIHSEFYKTTNGAMVRRGILQDIVRLVIHVTDINKQRVVDDMNDPELDSAVKEQLRLLIDEENQAETLHGSQKAYPETQAS